MWGQVIDFFEYWIAIFSSFDMRAIWLGVLFVVIFGVYRTGNPKLKVAKFIVRLGLWGTIVYTWFLAKAFQLPYAEDVFLTLLCAMPIVVSALYSGWAHIIRTQTQVKADAAAEDARIKSLVDQMKQ
jgi:hypothetical protein